MDQRLIPADPGFVRRVIATAYLSSPAVNPVLGSVVLRPHQLDAVGRILGMLRRDGGAVLADATGLGKTFVALAVSRAVGRTMVVAPAALRGMWHESLKRSALPAQVESYESLSRESPTTSDRPRLLILDEAQHARNPATRRYARIANLAWGTHVLALSATPVHNRRRDIRALLALFLGSCANDLSDDEVRRFIVRRTSEAMVSVAMPLVEPPRWLEVPRDPGTFHAIESIPPAVPAADGSPAHALMTLGLFRAWASSEAALRASLRRRLRRVASYFAALEEGRVPARHELNAWPVVDDAIQLGFPALFGAAMPFDAGKVQDGLVRHQEGVRAALRALDGLNGLTDRSRARHLLSIADRHAVPMVAFSQFADTARATFEAIASRGGAALVTGRGTRIASGSISTDEVVRGFDTSALPDAAMPLTTLVATDVLSEGLSLRRAGVVIHLDIPWTLARLEQRVGRLRRIGSPHRSVHVYAIGPPIESGELHRVLRTLQRKARLTSSVVGDAELKASLPLFGERLRRATARIARQSDASAAERLRTLAGRWTTTTADLVARAGPGTALAVVLLQRGDEFRLGAVREGAFFDRVADVSDAIESLGGPASVGGRCVSAPVATSIATWIDEQRARDLVLPATVAPSPAHVGVLRALHDVAGAATRADRSRVAERVEACRSLVMSACGIGAELAMERLMREGFHVDALEHLLASRPRAVQSAVQSWKVVAVVERVDGDPGVRAFIDESMHRGPRQSSMGHAAHAEAPG